MNSNKIFTRHGPSIDLQLATACEFSAADSFADLLAKISDSDGENVVAYRL